MRKISKAIRNIIWLYRPYWEYGRSFVFLSLFFWVVVIPLSRILMVVFPQQIVDALETGKTLKEIALIVIGFQIVFLIIPLFENIYNAFFRDRIQAKVEICIKRDVYEQALITDYKYIDNPVYYDKFLWAIDHQAAKANEAHSLVNSGLSALTIIVVLVGIISDSSPFIVVLTLLNMIIRTYGYMQYNREEVNRQDEIVPRDRRLNYYHRIFHLKDYSADLKSTSLREYLFRHYDEEAAKKLGIIKKYASRLVKWAVFSDVVYRISMTAVILLIAYNIYNGSIVGATTYITLMLAVDRLEEYMYELFELIKSGNRLGLYANNIRDFYNMESKIEKQMEGKSENIPDVGAFSVDFKNVSFQYDNSGFSITDLNIHISPGEKVAIVGENGVGKSTLLKLLLRLYDPLEGEIQINEIPLNEYDIHMLRKRIGVVFQDTNIYALTLRENMGLYNAPEEDSLSEILLSAGLSSMMEKNNGTIDTQVTKEFDETGIVMSGGEAQKIGLSRVMTGDFGLLLLDEPSSALDPIAEYEMNRLILSRSHQTTTILVAHRLSTVRDMDRIILMNNGMVAESGTHEELMALGGKYWEMFTKQAESYVNM